MVMLLYLRLQKSGWPLQACVFVGRAEEEVAVPEVVVELLRLAVKRV